MIHSRALTHGSLLALLLLSTAASAPAKQVCQNQTGAHDGFFYTFWKSSGDACMTLGARGRYSSRYALASQENLVVGKGWRIGAADRKIGYRAEKFDAGTNSYLTLYGWSTGPLIEYYIVENWGSGFTPPGKDSAILGTVTSDGGTYTIYRTERRQQPSIRGTQTFHQFWSVRTAKRPIGADSRITFANHVAAWRKLGMTLGTMDYQVMATEGFGSSGSSDVTLWEE
ncbi:MAG: 1,4-beta-xylanase [Oxalobacteraceae bacterium]|nr:MAG: 1,4-beta-xylanase [Oxalobacteraceae bacterium]